MSAYLLWPNIETYSLQIGLLVAVGACVPVLLRLRLPGARLLFWHILLAACLLLPLISRREVVVTGFIQVVTGTVAPVGPVAPLSPPVRRIPVSDIALTILGAGVLVRLILLGGGLWRLGHYRRQAQPFSAPPAWNSIADLRLSEQAQSPVTFGLRRPVILLPRGFPALHAHIQDAILCHEFLHVERHDWLFTICEELVRAVFWFHPAIWWLLGEIGLAREQEVDRLVVERTQAREAYVDALLAIAGARPQLDLAPAPLFLRKRHLKHRLVSILKEVRMSKKRWVSSLAAGLGILALACWFVTGVLPLSAAPQVVNDAPGVSVDFGAAVLLHRSSVGYPPAARERGIQGTVIVEAKLDGSGAVSDAHVVSGPDELRRTALESVLQWHFTREAAGSTRQVSITFQLLPGAQTEPPRKGLALLPPNQSGVMEERLRAIEGSAAVWRTPVTDPNWTAKVSNIDIVGLSDPLKEELLSRLPVRVGEMATVESLAKSQAAVREFDEHLLFATATRNDTVSLRISAPGAVGTGGFMSIPPPPAAAGAGTPRPNALRIGGNVQQTKLVNQVHPEYPALAKQAKIQGVVKLLATIGADGVVKHLEVVSGHPLLVPPALEAVKQWVYQPTLLNGNPIDVITDIDVNFSLSQ